MPLAPEAPSPSLPWASEQVRALMGAMWGSSGHAICPTGACSEFKFKGSGLGSASLLLLGRSFMLPLIRAATETGIWSLTSEEAVSTMPCRR